MDKMIAITLSKSIYQQPVCPCFDLNPQWADSQGTCPAKLSPAN